MVGREIVSAPERKLLSKVTPETDVMMRNVCKLVGADGRPQRAAKESAGETHGRRVNAIHDQTTTIVSSSSRTHSAQQSINHSARKCQLSGSLMTAILRSRILMYFSHIDWVACSTPQHKANRGSFPPGSLCVPPVSPEPRRHSSLYLELMVLAPLPLVGRLNL